MTGIIDIWVYLNASPLLWLVATILVYLAAIRLAAMTGHSPLANTVLISSAMLIVLLLLTRTPYEQYFEGAQFIHFLLGPVTVSLAIPLFHNLARIRRSAIPIIGALVVGSLTASGSAALILVLAGAPPDIVASIAPKSTTAPIAMEIARTLGGVPSLAAVLVVFTGVTGAVVVTPLMNMLSIRDYAARGFSIGIASHGIGTARAFQVDSTAGAFAGTAMALNGIFTSLLAVGWLALFGRLSIALTQ
ncbi:MAG: LrgB family protein [Devosia sp.]|nr:LrgB family protein [Devosia sp.]